MNKSFRQVIGLLLAFSFLLSLVHSHDHQSHSEHHGHQHHEHGQHDHDQGYDHQHEHHDHDHGHDHHDHQHDHDHHDHQHDHEHPDHDHAHAPTHDHHGHAKDQHDHNHDHAHDHAHNPTHHHAHDHKHDRVKAKTLPMEQRWFYGILAGSAVSLIGFATALMIVCCQNIFSKEFFDVLIKFLFSLAFASLLGDTMLHIMPEIYMSTNTDYKIAGGIFIASIVFFLILERLFESYDIAHEHWHHGEGQHNHPHQQVQPAAQQTQRPQIQENLNQTFWQSLKGKGPAGYLNLLGSLIHNWMDGLAIGVAFASGDQKLFLPIFIAIVAHQIPREMGDVAILMKNAFNPTQTVLCNGVINLISLVGLFIGLMLTELNEVATNYVLIFVAGNFIFIAADIWKNLFRNEKLWKNLVELGGIVIGVAIMYWILELEAEAGHDHSHGGHSHGHSHGHHHYNDEL